LGAAFVERVNTSGCVCVSIDLPSGLFANRSSLLHPVIRATHTLCLQSYKLAMLMAENDVYLGQEHLLSIALHPRFYEYAHTKYELQLLNDIKSLRPTRNKSA
ncbi:MAG: NAD(P)H-hydrate epimerase, partial [bacterium]